MGGGRRHRDRRAGPRHGAPSTGPSSTWAGETGSSSWRRRAATRSSRSCPASQPVARCAGRRRAAPRGEPRGKAGAGGGGRARRSAFSRAGRSGASSTRATPRRTRRRSRRGGPRLRDGPARGGRHAPRAAARRARTHGADVRSPSGRVALRNVVLTFDATPAPSNVLEASGGDARWEVEGGQLALGDVSAGDERAGGREGHGPVVDFGRGLRPPLSPPTSTTSRAAPSEPPCPADLRCVYDSDIERIAESLQRRRDRLCVGARDPLAARRRLQRPGRQPRGPVTRRAHAREVLALLARDMHDPAAAAQAEMLEALIGLMQ